MALLGLLGIIASVIWVWIIALTSSNQPQTYQIDNNKLWKEVK